jgi:hypothetical protein
MCESITISNMVGTSPNLVSNYSDMRFSQPNQASCTIDCSFPLVSSTSFSSSSPISLFLVHTSIIITEHKVMSSVSISPCHNPELTLSTAYTEYNIHLVQHTLSTVYPQYSIHSVQYILSTPSTQDFLSSLHSHNYQLTPEWSFSFQHASLHDQLPSATSPCKFKNTVTLSHSQVCESTN